MGFGAAITGGIGDALDVGDELRGIFVGAGVAGGVIGCFMALFLNAGDFGRGVG